MKYQFSNYICFEFKDIEIPKRYDVLKDMFSIPVEIKLCLLYSIDRYSIDAYIVIYSDNDIWIGYRSRILVESIIYDLPTQDLSITRYLR